MENSTASDQPGQSATISQSRVKKKLRWGWKILIGFPLLLGLFHLEENCRARHAWEHYKSELQASGRWIEYSQLIPPPIPDAENFAAIPLFTDLYVSNATYQRRRHWLDEMKGTKEHPYVVLLTNGCVDYITIWKKANGVVDLPKEDTNRRHRRVSQAYEASAPLEDTDRIRPRRGIPLEPTTNRVLIIPTNQTLAAEVLLNELGCYEPLLKQLEQVSQRPKARFNLNYSKARKPDGDWDYPHRIALSICCDLLSLRACIRLDSGSQDDAFHDVKLGMRLAGSITNEPFLNMFSSHNDLIRRPLLAIRKGLSAHEWSESHLKEIQNLIGQQNQWPNFLTHLRTGTINISDCITEDDYYKAAFWTFFPNPNIADPDDPPLGLVKILLPRNWRLFEKLNLLNMLDNKIMPIVDSQKGVASSLLFSQDFAQGFIVGSTPHPLILFRHRIWQFGSEGYLRSEILWQAEHQAYLDSAMLACALERYRLQNGGYPDALESLVPQFVDTLPPDPILGGSYKYHHDKPHHYILYSIGGNGIDDGGTKGIKDGVYHDDWVWSLPEH